MLVLHTRKKKKERKEGRGKGKDWYHHFNAIFENEDLIVYTVIL